MKYFKCGKCQSPYKIDESNLTTEKTFVKCNQCQSLNVIRSGPVLIAQNGQSIKKFNLKPGVNSIGRNAKEKSAEILIDDKYVSRKHADIILEQKDGKWTFFVCDNNSTNGTFNSKRDKLKAGLKYTFSKDDYFIIGVTKLSIASL